MWLVEEVQYPEWSCIELELGNRGSMDVSVFWWIFSSQNLEAKHPMMQPSTGMMSEAIVRTFVACTHSTPAASTIESPDIVRSIVPACPDIPTRMMRAFSLHGADFGGRPSKA